MGYGNCENPCPPKPICVPTSCTPAANICGPAGPYICQNNIPETKRCYAVNPCINIYSCHTQIM